MARRPVVAPLLAALWIVAPACRAQQHEDGTQQKQPQQGKAPLTATRLAPDTYVVVGPAGNSVVGVGTEGAVVVGAQSAAQTEGLRATVATLGTAPVRWVVATDGPASRAEGDAGWGKLGAFVVMHERLAGAAAQAGKPGREGFSEVIQLRVNDDEVHAVHQAAGYSDADVSAHFERAGVLYLGSVFTTDGYPAIDLANGGSLNGMIDEVGKFTSFPATMKVVPGRGPVGTTVDLRAYQTMLVAVRDAVLPMVRAGQPLAAVVAARPTAAFDARWGRGPVPAADFVAAAYHSLGGR